MTSKASEDAQKRDRAAALEVIRRNAVMTLAVATAQGPWAAPVYYAYRSKDNGFYFFSSPDSRHIAATQTTGVCSAAIFESAAAGAGTWREICGLQMQGTLAPANVSAGVKALANYLRKFPFSRELLPSGSQGLEDFHTRLGVRLYGFRPEHVEWTDNRIHFGYRCHLTL